MKNELTFRLETTRSDVDADASSEGVDNWSMGTIEPLPRPHDLPELDEARFLETVAVIVVAGITVIAKRLVESWLKDREQGVLIDVRDRPPRISRVAGIPAGFLVIVDAKGNPSTLQGSYNDPEALAPILQAALATRTA